MAYVYRKGNRIYIGYKDERGRHVQEATDAKTITEARRLGEELERRSERIRRGLEAPAPETMLFRQLAELYLREAAPQKRSYTTIEGRIRIHLLPAFGDRPLQEITPAEIRSFLAQSAKRYSPQTVEHFRRLLHVMFAYAIPELMRGPNPASLVPKIRIPKHELRFLDAQDVPRLLAAVPERWRALFATAIYTGARKGELVGLRRTDVDLGRRMIMLARSYDGPTKGSRPRAVPIPDELVPYLRAQLGCSEGSCLFPATNGEMLCRDSKLVLVLKRALVRAGLIEHWDLLCRRPTCRYRERSQTCAVRPCPKCNFRLWPRAVPIKLRFHDLRTTFGTHAYEATGDVRFVQTVLGHSDPRLTEERYSAIRNQHLLEQANRIRFGAPKLLPAASVSYPVLTGGRSRESAADPAIEKPSDDSDPCNSAPGVIRTPDPRLRRAF